MTSVERPAAHSPVSDRTQRSGSDRTPGLRSLRYGYGLLITVNFAMVTAKVSLYPAFFRQPNALMFFLEPAVMLCIYAGVVFAIMRNPDPRRSGALRVGTILGLVTGAMWVVNLHGETFTNLNATIGILSTAPFLLGGFFLRGLAGFLGAKKTSSLLLGILASVWCAMLCVLMTITYGFLLLYTSLPHLQEDLVNDLDWLHSGWNDLQGFAIANTFFAGFTHLLAAFLVGALVGAIGAGWGCSGQDG